MPTKTSVTLVVLTGGVGSRLWPLSRKSQPKQYLELFDGQSLFEKTVSRNADATNKLIVVGNIENYQMSNAVMNFDRTRMIALKMDSNAYMQLLD